MTIYVDKLTIYTQRAQPGAEKYFGNGKQSCHMFCDGDLEELHVFAARIGMRRSWFQNRPSLPHYDLTPNKRLAALLHGAQEVDLGYWLRQRREAPDATNNEAS